MKATARSALLGLDVGTTALKGVLFDLSGETLASTERTYALQAPHPGWVEQRPDEVWAALLETLRELTQQADEGRRILALALSAQSGSVIPAKKDGTPVYPMITWMDNRAVDIVRRWRAEGHAATIRARSGGPPQPGAALAIIAWLRRFRPDVFAAAERYFSVNDFLVRRMTGRCCTTPSNAGRTQLLNIATGQWDPTLCALAGVEPTQLSSVKASGVVVGRLVPEIREATGLPETTQVVNGAHDQACTALGLGVMEPGALLLAGGTSWVVTGVVDEPRSVELPAHFSLDAFPPPQRWTVSQSLGGLGAGLEWLLDRCWSCTGVERGARFAALNEALEATQPGSRGLFFLPLTGGRRPTNAPQAGAFLHLRLDHTRADMARAVLESAAFEVRQALDEVREARIPIEALWMIGGATRSPLWPQIVADVTRLPLMLPAARNWAAVGAALLAGRGVGVFETLTRGQRRFQAPMHNLTPNTVHTERYDDAFLRYRHWAHNIYRETATV